MRSELQISRSIEIDADASRVWDALTNPELIRQYLYGTAVVTDWKVGSEIIFQGIWEGKEYRDKGRIERLEVGKSLQYTLLERVLGPRRERGKLLADRVSVKQRRRKGAYNAGRVPEGVCK